MRLGDIAEQFQLECRGDAGLEITGIAGLNNAGPSQLSFLFNSNYRHLLESTEAGAVVLAPGDVHSTEKPVLVADQPRLAWAQIATLFDPKPVRMPHREQSAIISDRATLGRGVAISDGVVIKAGAIVRDGAIIEPGCVIGENVVVGAGTHLFPNVVLYHGVRIGDRCVVHAGSVIGADGFGFEFDRATGDYVKIPQVYSVSIGDDVEIGAGTTIDRGALNDTVVGDQCKIDNQVQIGHGTQVGHHTVISGCTAIAGSTRIGSYCLIGGAVGIIDNIQITDQVEITAMSLVSQSILEKGRYSSGTGMMPGAEWKRSIVGFRRLDEMLKRIRRLESGK